MENVLLITLSRQMTLRRELDVIANNVANAQTNGFKRRLSDSREYQMPVASDETFKRGADRRVSFVVDRGTPLDTTLGQLEPTGNPLDAAINGDAYFKVQTPQGERYTRNGAMMVNAKGELVNSDGHVMMGEQGVFQIANTERDLRVATDGSITSSVGTRGKLTLVTRQYQNIATMMGRADELRRSAIQKLGEPI